MKRTYDYESYLKSAFESSTSFAKAVIKGNGISAYTFVTLSDIHHERGWYFLIYQQDVARAKQEFYTCSKLDEATHHLVGNKTLDELKMPFNLRSVDAGCHVMNMLLSDNTALIDKHITFTYPEREGYIFKDMSPRVIIMDLIFSILRQDSVRFQQVWPLVEEWKMADLFQYDKLFLEGFWEQNLSKMQQGIEELASSKMILKKRNKVNPEIGPWENALISVYGIIFTKLAWMHGSELDIQAPLVRIAKALFPVEPLDLYETCYDFLSER